MKFNIGLFGFGTVGRGLYDVLHQVPNPAIHIAKVCVRNIAKYSSQGIDDVVFTADADDIFGDKDINFIVELISDADAAYPIVKRALEQGLPVVTGNKKMLAAHLPELLGLARQAGVPLLYDASACGSIPVIRNLEEYYDNDLLISVKGILNGSSNYVLSKIFNDGLGREEALQLAAEKGFLEADPSLDLDGWDALYKLVIITLHAFGIYIPPADIFTYGISSMSDADIRFAHEKDRRIKLVAHVEKNEETNTVSACVMPQLISRNKYIYSVEDEFNGVVIKGFFYGKQFMFGRGAGAAPTASAVLSDITACLYDYRYQYKKMHSSQAPQYNNDRTFRVYYRFSRPQDATLLHFHDIQETYRSDGNNYIVGLISLDELRSRAPLLRQSPVFLAAYPPD